ncbi:MAG: flavodoxin-dependent (E)-4-hydroxy-3-methylbut-2-enyl-diphosphate synthase [Candidatus Zixiibacteriota bacterium]
MGRKRTKKVWVGNVPIGGGSPITVQSMTTTDTRDIRSTLRQIRRLEKAGCEIVRVAVPDFKAANALEEIKREIQIPLVADIQFNHKLALKAIESGVDKLRINPGNIGPLWKVKEVVRAVSDKNIPIRIGVNSGSLPKDILRKYKGIIPEGMVEAAMREIKILEKMNYDQIVVSLKASDVPTTIESYRLISKKVNYPLHIGVTETGPVRIGSIKSAVGLGALLALGIGDTLRVSLTGDPVEEVKTGFEILKALNLRDYGPILISCPVCGRCEIDLILLVKKVEKELKKIKEPIKVAVMGCSVNGPGEAREADVGIAGGKGFGLLFRKGRVVGKVKEDQMVERLMQEVSSILKKGT